MQLEMQLRDLLGHHVEQFTMLQMVARGVIVYLWVLLCLRVGERRMMGKHTAMDVIIAVMIGSVASRPINSNAALLPTMAALSGLVALHWLLSLLAYRFETMEALLKGSPARLVVEGELQSERMGRYHITKGDLMESLRLRGNVGTIENCRTACLETSGSISAVHELDLKSRLEELQDELQRLRRELPDSDRKR